MIYLPLLHNITLLVSLSLIHGLLLGGFRRKGTGFSLLSGLAFGSAAILAMLSPLLWLKGIIFDGRSILLALAGVFGGPLAGLVAGLVAGAYRAWLGGAGMVMGLSVVAEATLLGIAWHLLRRRWPAATQTGPLFGFGVLVHLVMLALMALLPGSLSRQTFEALSLPVITLYPLGFTLIGRLLLEFETHFSTREALTESLQRLQATVDLAFDGYWRTSPEGRVLDVNEAICRTTGYARSELLTMSIHQLDALDTPEQVQERIARVRREGVIQFLTKHRHRDGHLLDVEVRVTFDPKTGDCLSFFKDITSLKRAEAERHAFEFELNHLQKLESLGRLAGGVAHDMNNILAAILSMAQVIRLQHGDVPGLWGSLAVLEQAAGRGRDLVKSLVGFTRKEGSPVVALDVNDLVRQELALLERTLMKKFTLISALEPGLPSVSGDPGALGNALMNLCVNAVDAMPEGGTLKLTTRTQGATGVEILVEDSGEGMPPEVLKRALEPFYTTKPMGKGTGLGLAQVFNAARAHGGYLHLESEPGQGTRAILGLPIEPAPPEALAPEGGAPAGKPLNLLLVDDEELIRATVPLLLGFLGHQVTAVASGMEALAFLEGHALPDLVILDLNMPGMNGLETLRALRKRWVDLPVLVATGFLEGQAEAVLAADAHAGVLAKPYSVSEFQAALTRLGPVAG